MKKYWQSIEEYQEMIRSKDLPEAEKKIMPEFNLEGLGDKELTRSSRRGFLKMLGFSVGYAAIATSCETPVRKAISYLNQPQEIVPGVANYYASSFFDGHDYCSVLVKTREGRPIKIEGNTHSKITLGGTQARVQASVLNLYDLSRLRGPKKDNNDVTWDEIDSAVIQQLTALAGDNKKVVLLTSTIISPSSRQLITQFIEKYPNIEWITYDEISSSAMLDANQISFGKKNIPNYSFDKADIIVGFNADFHGNWLLPVSFTKQYAKGRSLMDGKESISQHIQYESLMSLTGSNADIRVPIRPSDEATVLLNLYNEIASAEGAQTYAAPGSPVDMKPLAHDLLQKKGKSLIVSGTNDLNIQLIVNGINHLLGNYGNTIDLNKSILIRQGSDTDMVRLVEEMNNGEVAGLMMHNVNPAYDYAEADKFKEGLNKLEFTLSFAEQMDETAQLSQYVCPVHHYLESWDDAEAITNCFSTQQPAINPIFNTRQFQSSLLKWMQADPDYRAYISDYWENNIFPKQSEQLFFTDFWNHLVQYGTFTLEEEAASQPDFNPSDLQANAPSDGGIELVLYEKVGIGTGQYANNPWLQELPDPISLATWDNYICVGPAFAEEKGWQTEDIVNVSGIELPVLVQPGQAYGTIAIAVGYGRNCSGKVANGLGKNVYSMTNTADGYRKLSGKLVDAEATGSTYPLARTQSHNTMEGRAIVRETTLQQWKGDPKSGNEMHKDIIKQNQTLYDIPKYEGFHWGMAINLNACTGCSNCVISCQAENNIAVIGKEQVRNRRIMHWIRIDRYYSDLAETPEVVHQPVMCQHCDNAPCENVCPVAATPHSDEGLNQMIYNRCIGTRYCMNNCPYKVRRFNWFKYTDNDDFDYNMNSEQEKLVLNPDVTVRSRGVVEKCSLCAQRIQEKKLEAKTEGRALGGDEVKTACQQSCPGDAIVFGNMLDPDSEISKVLENPRTYQLLEQLHTLPSVSYLTKVRNIDPSLKDQNYMKYYPVYGDNELPADQGAHGSDYGHDH
ncbi:MAG: Fe-S-cluster-containing hydrogenase [Bacteroidota bacterium]